MIQEVLYKLENAMGKLTLHAAICPYNQQLIHHTIMSHIKNDLDKCIHFIILSFGRGVCSTITFCSLSFLAAKDFFSSWDTMSSLV